MKKQPFKTVIAPKGCASYLTEGKEYRAYNVEKSENDLYVCFNIISDHNIKLFCVNNECAHLNGGNWIIKE